jgi:molecular chaperone DnaK
LRNTLKGESVAEIKRALDALEQAVYKIAEQAYKAAGPPPSPQAAAESPGDEKTKGKSRRKDKDDDGGEVIDAEFETK